VLRKVSGDSKDGERGKDCTTESRITETLKSDEILRKPMEGIGE
jgi:hypothetical protein